MSKQEEEDYEKDYDTYWKGIIENEDGSVNLDQVKRELYDYSSLMTNATRVYMVVTGGMVSKTNTMSSSIISVYNEKVDEMVEEYNRQEMEYFLEDPKNKQKVLVAARQYKIDKFLKEN